LIRPFVALVIAAMVTATMPCKAAGASSMWRIANPRAKSGFIFGMVVFSNVRKLDGIMKSPV
jgi:hypothetical protein